MGFGDEIMAAGEAQTAHEADPKRRKVAILDRKGHPRWSDIWLGNPIIATPEEMLGGLDVNWVVNGTNARPYATAPVTVQEGVKFSTWRARDHRGKVYLTYDEMAQGRSLRSTYGPYWLIEPSPKKKSNPNKRWPFFRFQALVNRLDLTWVQPFHDDSIALIGARFAYAPNFREACGLLAGAAGYVGTEGGLHHAAAALGIPSVVIFGGCMSVETFGYPEHTNLIDTSEGSPCGHWLPCPHCAESMERITVENVIAAIRATRTN